MYSEADLEAAVGWLAGTVSPVVAAIAIVGAVLAVLAAALLLLSAFWHQTRGAVLAVMPAAMRARVPAL